MQALGGIKYIFLTHCDDGEAQILCLSPVFDYIFACAACRLRSSGIEKGSAFNAVADHAQWAKEFGAERIMHASECNSEQGTE